MSSQRRGPVKRATQSSGANAFAVVVEQLRGDFKVFGEALQGVERRLTARIDDLQDDVGILKLDVTSLQAAATQHTRELKGLRQALGQLGDHEGRISDLEKPTG